VNETLVHNAPQITSVKFNTGLAPVAPESLLEFFSGKKFRRKRYGRYKKIPIFCKWRIPSRKFLSLRTSFIIDFFHQRLANSSPKLRYILVTPRMMFFKKYFCFKTKMFKGLEKRKKKKHKN
jgi:hypothetical protein